MKRCPICCTEYTDEQTTCSTDNARLMTSTEWIPGQVVANKYRVIAKIGRGAMGAVYKAMHIGLEEIRALKVMDPQYARDLKFIARFRNEAQVARRLRHPNAVHVDDLDQADDGNLFIAMEFVEGVSLRQLISAARAPLSLARALWITRCVAEALGAAHALGMVHRDIKPDNILLARDASGRDIPKVLDFGIVAMREGSAIVSSCPLLTPAYAPPEQWQGMAASELDGRADIYALGMTLYEMLAAHSPFDAHSAEGWLRAHLDQVPPPPSVFNPALQGNADVDALVLRMLAKQRDQRPADANALIQELSLIEAQHTWGKGAIDSPVPPATPPPLPTATRPEPTVPAVEKVEKNEQEIPVLPARVDRFRAQTDFLQGRRKKIALGVGVSLFALTSILFPVIRMMSKQPPRVSVSLISGASAARPTTAAFASPPASDGALSGSSFRTAATAQPGISGDAPVSPVAASSQVDACSGKARCYSAGPFMAEVIGMTPSQTLGGFHVLQVNVRFRNLTNQPLILAYVAGSGVITDDNGKRYDQNYEAYVGNGAKGIGTVNRVKADPQFVLTSGASSNASFILARPHGANALNDPIGMTFNFDLSIAQLEVLPHQQVRTIRQYSVDFTDLGNSTWSRKAATVHPDVSGDASVSPVAASLRVYSCNGNTHCYNAGPFMAEVIRMMPSQTPLGYVGNHVL